MPRAMAATPLIPFDVAAVASEALAILRLTDQDADAGRVADYAAAAVEVIEAFLDPCEAWTDVPEAVQRAAAFVTVEEYRKKDAPFGVANAWSPDDYGPVRISGDWLGGVRYLLLPFKCAWGIA